MSATAHPTTITAPPGTPFLEMIREFDTPPERVWHATTDPALVVRWLGPARNQMRLDTWDVRTGGSYRYVQITPDGVEQGFRGVYHRVVPNRLSIATFEWEGAPDQVSLETVRYEDLSGRTRMVSKAVFPSAQALEMAMQNGMQEGMAESMDRLADLL